MYRDLSVALVAPVLDEAVKIRSVVRRASASVADQIVVVDDGSRDGSAAIAAAEGAKVLSLGETRGVGAALREGYQWALAQDFDVIATIAGNDKDRPDELPRLLDPIADGEADFVQGSRWLGEHADLGAMPAYRRLATRLHPLLFSLAAGTRVTESTNGFRAFRAAILRDPAIDLSAPWLDGYELEPWLYLSVLRAGYRTAEAPVSKIYPPRALGQTKMNPMVDWWAILRPLAWAMRMRIEGRAG